MPGHREYRDFILADGTQVTFESDLPAASGAEQLTGRRGEAQAEERFDVVLQRIRPVAQSLLDSLKDLNTPQEISLEFGVKLGGEAGVVFASATSECNFKVALKWTNDRPE